MDYFCMQTGLVYLLTVIIIYILIVVIDINVFKYSTFIVLIINVVFLYLKYSILILFIFKNLEEDKYFNLFLAQYLTIIKLINCYTLGNFKRYYCKLDYVKMVILDLCF